MAIKKLHYFYGKNDPKIRQCKNQDFTRQLPFFTPSVSSYRNTGLNKNLYRLSKHHIYVDY